jgi:hypothetical protein
VTADTATAGAVLAKAFADDPVFGWMLPDGRRRELLLPGLFELFVEAYAPLHASQIAGAGVALWAPLGRQAVPEDAAERFAERIAAAAGPDTDRIFVAMAALKPCHPHRPCHYLNFLGVDPAARGRASAPRCWPPRCGAPTRRPSPPTFRPPRPRTGGCTSATASRPSGRS